jgi:hypothetical protein
MARRRKGHKGLAGHIAGFKKHKKHSGRTRKSHKRGRK